MSEKLFKFWFYSGLIIAMILSTAIGILMLIGICYGILFLMSRIPGF